jgi:hypothetical protein
VCWGTFGASSHWPAHGDEHRRAVSRRRSNFAVASQERPHSTGFTQVARDALFGNLFQSMSLFTFGAYAFAAACALLD